MQDRFETRKPLWRRVLRALLIAIVIFIVASWLAVLMLRFLPPATSAFMIERRVGAALHGEHDFHVDYRWVPWSRIAPVAPLAMVAGEDQKFPFHHGFDFESIHTAIDQADQGMRLRGASTISQQTAKNLFLWNDRSFVRKGIEAWFTVLIEATWPKRRILEVYANIAELGDGIYGVEAASEVYFGEHASQLTVHQAALLAAVLPDPRRLHADRPSSYV
ncbi:MAG: monofunctional biosynthetic peptidoglycan transglycosylase, partial [Rhodanobacteraceae bacterium]